MAVTHRIPIPRGAVPRVEPGDQVQPDEVLAMRRAPGSPIVIDVAGGLRRSAVESAEMLLVHPGERLVTGDPIARSPEERLVSAPMDGLLIAYSRTDGTALIAPLGDETPVIGHVSGIVRSVDEDAIVVEVRGAMLSAVGGTGEAVHGELVIAVRDPGEELRAGAIDVGATGKILVGGSRASAETLTRARAMGVAGIVLGGVLDKELRDFEAIQRRRREIGGLTGSFGLVLLEGFGKVGFDAQLFRWFRQHVGHLASIFGNDRRVYVYDAAPPPRRRPLPHVGDRVVAHRRPFQGSSGVLVALLDDLHATPSGIPSRMALVRFEDGRLAPVPLPNLEATGQASGAAGAEPADAASRG
jgi:hypothetical protein